jgi:predicted NAD/FAD-dependent oxidoreductase
MRVPAEKPEAFRTAGGGAADSGLEQQDACKDQSWRYRTPRPSAKSETTAAADLLLKVCGLFD